MHATELSGRWQDTSCCRAPPTRGLNSASPMPKGATARWCLPQYLMVVLSVTSLPLWALLLVKCQPVLNCLPQATRQLCSPPGSCTYVFQCPARHLLLLWMAPAIQAGAGKELRMVKWMCKMVEIHGFGNLCRLLQWFRVGSEPKPLITQRFGRYLKSGSTSEVCIWLIPRYRHGVLWFYSYSRGTFSCMPRSRQRRWGSLCDLYSR